MRTIARGFATFALSFVILISLNCFGHEIRPAIVDLTFKDDKSYELKFVMNLEALISNVGPERGDISESENADIYDGLRLLSPYELE